MKTMILVAAIGSVVGLALIAGPAAAADCNGSVTAVGDLYIDDRGATEGGIWVYQESNGIAGLQSGGASVALGDLDVDSCFELDAEGNPLPPDTLIF